MNVLKQMNYNMIAGFAHRGFEFDYWRNLCGRFDVYELGVRDWGTLIIIINTDVKQWWTKNWFQIKRRPAKRKYVVGVPWLWKVWDHGTQVQLNCFWQVAERAAEHELDRTKVYESLRWHDRSCVYNDEWCYDQNRAFWLPNWRSNVKPQIIQ
jgi:hypothetical protein